MRATRAILMTGAWLGLAILAMGCTTDPEPTGPNLAWESLAEGYEPGALLSIWSNGPDNVWVVGGEPGHAVVLAYDGAQWDEVDAGVEHGLRWIHGFDSGEVFVAGDAGTISRCIDTVCTPMDTGDVDGATFWGIWGSAPDDVYAVGGPYFQAASGVCAHEVIAECEEEPSEAPSEDPSSCHAAAACDDGDPCTTDLCDGGVPFEKDIVVHFDGTSWTRMTLPDQEGPSSGQLYKVWGSSADDVFIVGSEGRTLHGGGGTWEWVDAGVGSLPLWTVAGFGPDRVYAVGGLFNNATLIRWDGNQWENVPLAEEQPSMLQGLWINSLGTVHVAGPEGYTAALPEDGEWVLGAPITTLQYHAITGDGAGGLYVAGGDIGGAKEHHVGVLSTTAPNVPQVP